MFQFKSLSGKKTVSGRSSKSAAFNRAVAFAVERLETRTFLSAGQLDPTFGNGGIVQDLSLPAAQVVAVQADGKIVEAGSILGNLSVARFNANGTPDTSFGYQGRLITDLGGDDTPASILIQPDGKIDVFANSANLVNSIRLPSIVRYNPDGQRDGTVNPGRPGISEIGGPGETIIGASLLPGGKIMVLDQSFGSYFSQNLHRFNSDATVDTTFGSLGVVQAPLNFAAYSSTIAQPDGKLIALGQTLSGNSGAGNVILRFNTDGSQDVSFTNAAVAADHQGITSIALGADGKLVVALTYGTAQYGLGYRYLTRFNADGATDATFGTNGVVAEGAGFTGYFKSVAVQSDGRVVAEVDTVPNVSYLERFNSNGTRDMTFNSGNGGFVSTPPTVAIYAGPGGTTLVNASQTSLLLARHTGDDMPLGVGEAPFTSPAPSIPGRIEAENFDIALELPPEGIAYHTTNPINYTSNLYRTSAITIENSGDTGGGYNVGYLHAGDYLKYTVNAPAAGNYDLSIRAANPAVGGSFHVEVDGVDVTGNLAIPNTSGWQKYTTLTKTGIALTAGNHIVKLMMDTNNAFGFAGNFNWLQFSVPNVVPVGGSISGNVYNDANADGARQPLEPGVIGYDVYLDIPGIGKYVAGDPLVSTSDTGAYTFTGLKSGNYLVRVVPKSGQVVTSPIFGGKFFVQLGANQAVTGDDFGVKIVDPVSVTQTDGKILDTGLTYDAASFGVDSNLTLHRFFSDGTVDTDFGVHGTVTLPDFNAPSYIAHVDALIPRLDGSIIVLERESTVGGVTTDLSIVSAAGQIVRTIHGSEFGANLIPSRLDTLTVIGLAADGKILAAGYHYPSDADNSKQLLVKRYNSDLSPDTTFATGGVAVIPSILGTPTAVTGLADGRIRVTYSDKTVFLTNAGGLSM